jgi:hypothetical protein
MLKSKTIAYGRRGILSCDLLHVSYFRVTQSSKSQTPLYSFLCTRTPIVLFFSHGSIPFPNLRTSTPSLTTYYTLTSARKI